MSLTFPRPFPHHEFVQAALTPHRRQATGSSEGGDDFVIDRGAPTWIGSWKTKPLSHLQFGEWRAWLASLGGQKQTFLGYDPSRALPLAYMMESPSAWPPGMLRFDRSSFDGTVSVSDFGTGRAAPVLAGLPAGFRFTAGDYISLIEGGRYSLHTVLESVIAGISGGAALSIEPEVPGFFTTAAVVNLFRPCAKFVLQGATPDMTADGAGRNRPGDCSFTAYSTLR